MRIGKRKTPGQGSLEPGVIEGLNLRSGRRCFVGKVAESVSAVVGISLIVICVAEAWNTSTARKHETA